jgi:hypothetical protein
MSEITVILNCYRRPEYLLEQIQAVENQTIKPKEIWIWYNSPEDREPIDLNIEFGKYKIVQSNFNFKFHARFALGLLSQTEYVAFFDDDTIPGKDWFLNCLNTLERVGDCILGTTGVILSGATYENNIKVGWNGINNEVEKKVDLVGHAWFMRQRNLKYLWYEEPESLENGEDMQLSYLCQKYGNLKTIVPPHGKNLNFWGSIPSKGKDYGCDSNATWLHRPNHKSLRNQIVSNLVKRGWKLVKDENPND